MIQSLIAPRYPRRYVGRHRVKYVARAAGSVRRSEARPAE
jgi:hypothetical protein